MQLRELKRFVPPIVLGEKTIVPDREVEVYFPENAKVSFLGPVCYVSGLTGPERKVRLIADELPSEVHLG